LHTDPELSSAWRARFLAPRRAVTSAVFERAAARGEVRPDLDLEVILTVLPSMCAFRCTVEGHVVDEAFVTRVLDQVLLPAVTRPQPTPSTNPMSDTNPTTVPSTRRNPQ
jgi:hypothetical protein